MSLAISIISLIISGLTFWFTRLFRGTLKMTRPTLICFLGKNGDDNSKIFIRMLLYSTSDLGVYIENMFIKVTTEQSVQTFNIWAYGDKQIVRGSGLFVNKGGFSAYHHFLLSNETDDAPIAYGNYKLEVFAEVVNREPKKLFEQTIAISQLQSYNLNNGEGIYFDWAPEAREYIPHTNIKGNFSIRSTN